MKMLFMRVHPQYGFNGEGKQIIKSSWGERCCPWTICLWMKYFILKSLAQCCFSLQILWESWDVLAILRIADG